MDETHCGGFGVHEFNFTEEMDNYFPPDDERDNLEDIVGNDDYCGRGRRRGRR